MTRPEHPFAAMQAQMRKPEKQGGGFAGLTEQQKWEWHADVYAFRRVVLGIRPERGEMETTPPDPKCEWFTAALVERAEAYYLERYKSAAERRQKARSDEMQLEGRDIVNRWAQSRGYLDLDAYAAAKGIEWIEAYREYSVSPEFQAVIKKLKARQMGMSEAETDHRAVAAALGLSAKEQSREFAPTAEEMAASRSQLGIGEPAPEAAA